MVIAINAGGATVTAAGVEYIRDRFYTGGTANTTTDPIGGVSDGAIYQSERYGTYSYEIPVTEASYSVKLHFVELYQTEAAARSFNVSVEGRQVLSAVDLFALVGHDYAHAETVERVAVTDGRLSIRLEGLIDNATLSAIEVYSADGGAIDESVLDGSVSCPYVPPVEPENYPRNWTAGDVTVFNDNGGWTWYNDERAVVDVAAGKLVVGSAASNGSSSIDVVVHDLVTGQNVKKSLGTLSYPDDHNNPGIVIKAPGEYFAAYAHHNVDCNSYWSNFANGSWGRTVTFNWTAQGLGCPWNNSDITYNNTWQLSEEGRLYNFVRSVDTSPNFLVSVDGGNTWTFGGRLTASPQVGYNAGYYKYWGNGTNRIDFFATESHPRDSNTSLYHGYIQDGKSYDSNGTLVDNNIFDRNAPQITQFTRVFRAGAALGGVTLNRLWNFDVARYEDGTIGVLWQGRENQCGKCSNPGHHLAYSRFDGNTWSSTRLVKGGRTLYRDNSDWWEEDYLGGAALDPDDSRVIYISTPIDPRNDSTNVGNHEIWKGVTCDGGATFAWSPMTMNSDRENLRPAVPAWDAQNTALLWFRGDYQTAQNYDAEVVGILTRE